MNKRACPICTTPSEAAAVFLEESIDPAKMSASSYASRKVPEFMSHRLVCCPVCDLVYVPEPPGQRALAQAYHEASYDSAEEAQDAARSYANAISPVLGRLASRRAALEIGTGTGVFLEELGKAGFISLTGVEPSVAAINAAPPHRRAWIREGIFQESAFQPESFDLVCCFMTMEHVADPAEVATAAFRLLRPGGVFVTVTHDYRSLVNRMLGSRSPIIDVEHMQLFSQQSLQELFTRSGYQMLWQQPFVNRYAMAYWLRLMPLPAALKSAAAKVMDAMGLSRRKVGINVGNIICAGFKPPADAADI